LLTAGSYKVPARQLLRADPANRFSFRRFPRRTGRMCAHVLRAFLRGFFPKKNVGANPQRVRVRGNSLRDSELKFSIASRRVTLRMQQDRSGRLQIFHHGPAEVRVRPAHVRGAVLPVWNGVLECVVSFGFAAVCWHLQSWESLRCRDARAAVGRRRPTNRRRNRRPDVPIPLRLLHRLRLRRRPLSHRRPRPPSHRSPTSLATGAKHSDCRTRRWKQRRRSRNGAPSSQSSVTPTTSWRGSARSADRRRRSRLCMTARASWLLAPLTP
jgi:hypothetical protein